MTTAHHALTVIGLHQYTHILSSFLSRLSEARNLVDVNIAAGIAIEEIELTGQQVGTAPTDGLKPI